MKEGSENQAVDESKKNSNSVLKVCINLGVDSSHFYLLSFSDRLIKSTLILGYPFVIGQYNGMDFFSITISV